MMNEELKAVWKSLVEFCSRHQDVEDNRAIVAAAAELKELKELRDELVTMAKHLLSWIDDHAEIIDEELNAKAKAAIAMAEGGAKTTAPTMPLLTGVAARKLASLIEGGYRINGVAVRRDQSGLIPKQGFVTDAGLVGWWPEDKEGNTP